MQQRFRGRTRPRMAMPDDVFAYCGNFANILVIAWSTALSTFSGEDDTVAVAVPRQIAFCVALSNMSTISVPTS